LNPGGPPGGVQPVTAPLAPSSTVTLITGDRVRLDVAPGGQQSATITAPAASAGARLTSSTFVRFTWAGDQYVVPDKAVPYLGSTLDPRLFDVSYLVRARLDDAHSSALPVKIGYSGAPARVNLAGVHVTRGSAGTATAAVSEAQAGRLGQLLASQWRSSRTGHSPVPVGRLPGITRISLAPPPGAPALPAPLPQATALAGPAGKGLHYHTLTLNFAGENGNPGTAMGFVQNVDDARLGIFVLGNYPGVAGPVSFSVPDGTYSIAVSMLTPHAGTIHGTDGTLAVKPQVTVDSNQTITLDARTARQYSATLDSPTATSVREDILGFTRTSAAGGGVQVGGFYSLVMGLVSVSGDGYSASKLSATPTNAVTKGIFGFDASTFLTNAIPGTSGTTSQPTYLFSFTHAGSIPSSLTYTVPKRRLTTLHESLNGSPSGALGCPPLLIDFVYQPWGSNLELGFSVPLGNRTDYWYSSNPELDRWASAFNADDCTRRYDAIRAISPGQQISETWNKAPLAPSPADWPTQAGQYAPTGNPMLTVCAACRQDNNGMLYLSPYGDSDPAHYSVTYPDGQDLTSELSFYRNHVLALTSKSWVTGHLNPFGLDLPLLPTAATYRLDWTDTRNGDAAASNDTNWTFRSGPADTAAALPKTEQCAPDTTRACAFLPLLFINYDLALNDKSQATAGAPFRIAFTVSHQQNQAPPSGVTATVSASFDDGKTWTAPQAAASLGGGKFATTISQPPLAGTTGFVSLRVTARDGAGNTVQQTIIRAYGLTS
jgi:hypothetical protein